MYKVCKDETVIVNYDKFGCVSYTSIHAVAYDPLQDKIAFLWADGEVKAVRNASDIYGFITFEDGIEIVLNGRD